MLHPVLNIMNQKACQQKQESRSLRAAARIQPRTPPAGRPENQFWLKPKSYFTLLSILTFTVADLRQN
jgi:hypothetical protein